MNLFKIILLVPLVHNYNFKYIRCCTNVNIYLHFQLSLEKNY